jgi:transcriptional regulator with XRE-family HTH domain
MMMSAKTRLTSRAYGEPDASTEKETERPIRDQGIGRFPGRLREAIGSEGVRSFSRRAGISEGAVFSYLSSQTYPTLDRLDALAVAADRDPRWFIAPETESQSQSHLMRLDKKTLSRAARILDMALAMAHHEVSQADRLDLIADLYQKLILRGQLGGDELLEITEELSKNLNAIKESSK